MAKEYRFDGEETALCPPALTAWYIRMSGDDPHSEKCFHVGGRVSQAEYDAMGDYGRLQLAELADRKIVTVVDVTAAPVKKPAADATGKE